MYSDVYFAGAASEQTERHSHEINMSYEGVS